MQNQTIASPIELYTTAIINKTFSLFGIGNETTAQTKKKERNRSTSTQRSSGEVNENALVSTMNWHFICLEEFYLIFFFAAFFSERVAFFIVDVNWSYFWCLLVYCWINSQLLDVIIGVVLLSGCLFFVQNIVISRHTFCFLSFLVIRNFSVSVTTLFLVKHKHNHRFAFYRKWSIGRNIEFYCVRVSQVPLIGTNMS